MTRDLSPAVVAEIAKPSIHPRFFVELDFLSAPVRLWNGLGQFEWDGKTWTGAGDLLGFDEIEEASDGSATTVTLTVSGIPSSLTGPIYQDQWQGRSAYIWFGMMRDTGPLLVSGDPITVIPAGEPYEWVGTIQGGTPPYTPSIANAPDWMSIDLDGESTFRVYGTAEAGITDGIIVSVADSGGGAMIGEPIMLRQGVMDTLNDADDGKSATFSLAIQTEALDQGNNRSWRLTNEIQQEFFPGDKGLEYTVALQKIPLRWGATQATVRTIKSFVQGII